MHKFLFYNKLISCLYMFRKHVLIIRRSKLHFTASDIITPIGGRLLQRLQNNNIHYCKTKILCINLVNYWDKYTEIHGQQNVKKNSILFLTSSFSFPFSNHFLNETLKSIITIFIEILIFYTTAIFIYCVFFVNMHAYKKRHDKRSWIAVVCDSNWP